MKTVLLILTLALASSAHAQVAGSWQWVLFTYSDLPTASAGLATGVSDPLPPVLIQTSDAAIPFIVFRWQFVDITFIPPGFTFFVGEEVAAVKDYKDWKNSVTFRHIGVVTTGDHAIAVAWYTHD